MTEPATWRAVLYASSGRRWTVWWGRSFEALVAWLVDPDCTDVVEAHVRAPDERTAVLVRESRGGRWSNTRRL